VGALLGIGLKRFLLFDLFADKKRVYQKVPEN